MKTNKIITFFSSAMLIALTFTSCGSKNDETKNSKPVSESDSQAETKTQLTLALPWNDTEITKAANIFNKSNDKYEVTVKSAYNSSDRNNFDDAMQRIQMNILSGDAPDIIAASPAQMLSMIKKGYMADIYPLMENYDGVKKEDFLPNVLDALDFDGKLPAVCTSFSIDTVVAKTEFVGEDSADWTLDQAIDCYENLPEDMDFSILPYEGAVSPFKSIILSKLGHDSIDCKANTCKFSEDFRRAVDYIDSQGEIEVKNKRVYEKIYIDDYAVAAPVLLTGFNCILAYDIYAQFGGEDITFVGYPSTNGCGAITYSSEMYGILENSSNKEAAWEFLNQLFDYNKTSPIGSNLYYSFSVLSDALEIPARDNDQYSNFALKFPQQASFSDNPDDEMVIDDATIQKTLDYIKNLKFDFYYDEELDNIIDEEIGEMLGGTRSPEECIKMLENRISIYINEKG